jgi:hypothetical protein
MLSARMSDRAASAAAERDETKAPVLEMLVARLHKKLQREMRLRERTEARARVLGKAHGV